MHGATMKIGNRSFCFLGRVAVQCGILTLIYQITIGGEVEHSKHRVQRLGMSGSVPPLLRNSSQRPQGRILSPRHTASHSTRQTA